MNKATYARKLKDARIAAGYTQAAVADLIGRPQPTVGAWEVGRSQPDVDTLATLLRLYNVSANDFFDYVPSAVQYLSLAEQEHIKKYRTLDEHGKRIVDFVLNEEIDRMNKQIIQFGLAARDGEGDVITATKETVDAAAKERQRLLEDDDQPDL